MSWMVRSEVRIDEVESLIAWRDPRVVLGAEVGPIAHQQLQHAVMPARGRHVGRSPSCAIPPVHDRAEVE